jgi:peptidoglycan/xylan/chitin deacetylase (PgdA/CDA1 family)
MLNWDEIREMAAGNVTFGAHTVTHPILTRISVSHVIAEIINSKMRIEEKLGRRIFSFAYPNGQPGDYDRKVIGIVKDAGFSCAVTTIWGNNDRDTDPYELRRIGLWGTEPDISVLRLSFYKIY